MTTGLEIFDKTVEVTNQWLKDIMYEMGWEDDRHKAYSSLRAVLQTLRDRLTPGEATDFGAQLPMLIRGIYYEGWHPADKPLKIRNKDEFIDQVRKLFTNDPGMEEAERITRAVFKMLNYRISEGQAGDIKTVLPKEIASLWPMAV